MTRHEQLMAALIPLMADIIESIVDDSECWLDHHGGCQAHGFLDLDPGEECPNAMALRLVSAWNAEAKDDA